MDIITDEERLSIRRQSTAQASELEVNGGYLSLPRRVLDPRGMSVLALTMSVAYATSKNHELL